MEIEVLTSRDFKLRSAINFFNIRYAIDVEGSRESFFVTYRGGIAEQYIGSFSYRNDIPASGTITEYYLYRGAFEAVRMIGIDLSVSSFLSAARTRQQIDDISVISRQLRGNDSFSGGSGNDAFEGFGGRDQLLGNRGRDILDGGAGQDTIVGGEGQDRLIGGSGRDTFYYRNVSDVRKTYSAIERIEDFETGLDKIDLSNIDANTVTAAGDQQFLFISSSDFSRQPGELRFESEQIEGDIDGNGRADFHIKVISIESLVSADFIL